LATNADVVAAKAYTVGRRRGIGRVAGAKLTDCILPHGVTRSGAVGMLFARHGRIEPIPKRSPMDHGAKNACHCCVIMARGETFSPFHS
jgi:hypothetical protein